MVPLMSCTFVDVNIVRRVIKSGNIYMYKEKVPIPPLIMQLLPTVRNFTFKICGYEKKT